MIGRERYRPEGLVWCAPCRGVVYTGDTGKTGTIQSDLGRDQGYSAERLSYRGLQPHIRQVGPQIHPFILPETPQGKTDQRPQMDRMVISMVVFVEVMYLRMTIMTGGYAVFSPRSLDLIEFYLAVLMARIGVAGLEVSSAASTTVIIGLVGGHINKILFAHNRFDHKSKVVSDRIPQGFPDYLAGILDSECHFQVFIPVGVDLQLPLSDPLGVKLDNALKLKVVGDIEFFESGPDRVEFVASFRVEPDLAPQILQGLDLDP